MIEIIKKLLKKGKVNSFSFSSSDEKILNPEIDENPKNMKMDTWFDLLPEDQKYLDISQMKEEHINIYIQAIVELYQHAIKDDAILLGKMHTMMALKLAEQNIHSAHFFFQHEQTSGTATFDIRLNTIFTPYKAIDTSFGLTDSDEKPSPYTEMIYNNSNTVMDLFEKSSYLLNDTMGKDAATLSAQLLVLGDIMLKNNYQKVNIAIDKPYNNNIQTEGSFELKASFEHVEKKPRFRI